MDEYKKREKVYFLPGDPVTLRQDVNAPNMYVVKKATKKISLNGGPENEYFQGILCR